MASTRQGSRQYRKLKVSNDQGFSLSKFATNYIATIAGIPGDMASLVTIMSYFQLPDKTEQDERDFIELLGKTEIYGSESLNKAIGGPEEGLESLAEFLVIGLGGTSKLGLKAVKKPVNRIAKKKLLKKAGVETPLIKETPIDIAERRNVARLKKQKQEKIKAQIFDDDDAPMPDDPDLDVYDSYTEEDMLIDNALDQFDRFAETDDAVIQGSKQVDLALTRQKKSMSKLGETKQREMTDAEMYEQLDIYDNDAALPIEDILPSDKKIIQFQPRG